MKNYPYRLGYKEGLVVFSEWYYESRNNIDNENKIRIIAYKLITYSKDYKSWTESEREEYEDEENEEEVKEVEKRVEEIKFLICGTRDNQIFKWDLDKPKKIPIGSHEDSVTSVKIYQKGEKLASGSADNVIRIWDLQKNNKIVQFWYLPQVEALFLLEYLVYIQRETY